MTPWQILQTIPVRSNVTRAWKDITVPVTQAWYSSDWSPELNLFVVVGVGANCITSPDGINWTSRNMPSNKIWNRVHWVPFLHMFIASTTDTFPATTNVYATSTDGINWTGRTYPTNGNWAGIADNGSTVVVMEVNGFGGGSQRTLTSSDGINWSVNNPATPAFGNWDGVVWAPELGLFVSVSSNSTNAGTSPDGVNWTLRTLPSNHYWVLVAWSGSLFVVTNFDSPNSTTYLTSPDGINWTARTLPLAQRWLGICYSKELGMFMMVGWGGFSLGSTDGITWAQYAMGSNRNWYTVAWGAGANAFVGMNSDSSSNILDVLVWR